MKRTLKTVCTLFLALALVSSFSLTAFAAEEDLTIIELDPNDVVYVEEVIGTPEGQTGVLLEDAPKNTRAADKELFSMTATRVTELLTTYNSTGKYFLGNDVNYKQAIKIEGKVSMSMGEGEQYNVKVGVCYYDASTNTFVSVGYSYFDSGVEDVTYIEQYRNGVISQYKTFLNYERYYGHITNRYTGGYAYGTLTFYLVDNPYAT